MTTGKISTKQIEEALKTASAGTVERVKRNRLTDEERAARELEKLEELNKKKEARAEKKRQRELARSTKPAHMTKVERAGERLPVLSDRGQELLTNAFDSMEEGDISAFVAHVLHQLRVKSTQASAKVTLEVGQTVRIQSGATNHIGSLAKVVKAQRIRCYVQPFGTDKKVYLYATDVVPVTEAEALTSESTDNVRQIRATA